MPYLWQGALSIVSQTLLVMGATMSPSLSNILLSLVPHRDTIDQIINDVVMEIERYAVLAPEPQPSRRDHQGGRGPPKGFSERLIAVWAVVLTDTALGWMPCYEHGVFWQDAWWGTT